MTISDAGATPRTRDAAVVSDAAVSDARVNDDGGATDASPGDAGAGDTASVGMADATAGETIAPSDAGSIDPTWLDLFSEALLEPGHASKHYTLTGPEALTFAEAVRQIGRAADHLIHHDDPPLDHYLNALAAKGAAQKTLDYYRRIYGCIRDGRAAAVSPDVLSVTGHSPRGFSAFVEENRAAWRR